MPYFNTFILIGGRNETSPATSVLKYDGGEEETWTQVATLRSGRMDLTAFLLTFRCGSHTGRYTPNLSFRKYHGTHRTHPLYS